MKNGIDNPFKDNGSVVLTEPVPEYTYEKPLKKGKGYKLAGVRDFHGLTISVEHNKGGIRKGVDKDGHEWETKMHYAYGGIRNTKGADGEYVDVYIGDDVNSSLVFIVHQNDPVTHKYDEDKCMIQFLNAGEAKKAYLKQYDRPGFFGSMDQVTVEEFKQMLKDHKGVKLKKSMTISPDELMKAYNSASTLTVTGTDCTFKEFLKPFLEYVKKIGGSGHSFSIVVDPDDSENRKVFGFDGDGAARIDTIKVVTPTEKSGVDFLEVEGLLSLYKVSVMSPESLLKQKVSKRSPKGLLKVSKGLADELEQEGAYVEGQPKIFTAEQVQQGIRVEMEHTDNVETAKQIAYDRLAENLDYYSYLEEMEEQMEARKSGEHKLVLSKGRKMPINTISHGRKKVAEGKWVPVGSTKKDSGSQEELSIIKNSKNMGSYDLAQKFKHYTKVAIPGAKGRFDYSTDAFSNDNAITYAQKLNKQAPDYIEYTVNKQGNSSAIAVYLKTKHTPRLYVGDWRIPKEEVKKSMDNILMKSGDKAKLAKYKKALLDFLQGDMKKSRGYSTGTIREWSGKNYKKMANGKWMRVYAGGQKDRGMDQAVKNTIKKIENATTMEELVEIVRNSSSRFKGANGYVAEVVKDLMGMARGTEAGKKKQTKEQVKKEWLSKFEEGVRDMVMSSNAKGLKVLQDKYDPTGKLTKEQLIKKIAGESKKKTGEKNEQKKPETDGKGKTVEKYMYHMNDYMETSVKVTIDKETNEVIAVNGKEIDPTPLEDYGAFYLSDKPVSDAYDRWNKKQDDKDTKYSVSDKGKVISKQIGTDVGKKKDKDLSISDKIKAEYSITVNGKVLKVQVAPMDNPPAGKEVVATISSQSKSEIESGLAKYAKGDTEFYVSKTDGKVYTAKVLRNVKSKTDDKKEKLKAQIKTAEKELGKKWSEMTDKEQDKYVDLLAPGDDKPKDKVKASGDIAPKRMNSEMKKDSKLKQQLKEHGMPDWNLPMKELAKEIKAGSRKAIFYNKQLRQQGVFTDGAFMVTDPKFAETLYAHVDSLLAGKKFTDGMKDIPPVNYKAITKDLDEKAKDMKVKGLFQKPEPDWGDATSKANSHIMNLTDPADGVDTHIRSTYASMFMEYYGNNVTFKPAAQAHKMGVYVNGKTVGLVMGLAPEVTDYGEYKPVGTVKKSMPDTEILPLSEQLNW